jgi:hypothetical protein
MKYCRDRWEGEWSPITLYRDDRPIVVVGKIILNRTGDRHNNGCDLMAVRESSYKDFDG